MTANSLAKQGQVGRLLVEQSPQGLPNGSNMAAGVLFVLFTTVLSLADSLSSISDTNGFWRSRESSLTSVLESLHVTRNVSGKAQWMDLREQLGPPLAYTNGTSLCNGHPVDPEHVKCIGVYEATAEYSRVTKRGAVFTRSKATCAGSWQFDIDQTSSRKIVISASCKGIFRDISSVVTRGAHNTTYLSDYHCAFTYDYSVEGVIASDEVHFSEVIDCRLSEFARVLENEEKPTGSDNIKDSLKELEQKLGMVFVPKDSATKLPQDEISLNQHPTSNSSITKCVRMVSCNKLPASPDQPCRGVLEDFLFCKKKDFERICDGAWTPYVKAAICKGAWSVNFYKYTTSSTISRTSFCNGDTALATEDIEIMGHEFHGNAASCFGTAGTAEVEGKYAPGPAPGPGAEWQVDAAEQEVLQVLDPDYE